MSDPAVAAELERALDARRVGPSMWGDIYRLPRTFLRIIPNGTAGITAQRRHELAGWPGRPAADGLARVIRTGQEPLLPGRWFDLVEYEADGTPLAAILAGRNAADRTAAAARVLRALPGWWAALDGGLLPMAGDVVLTAAGPSLLRTPQWGVPGPADLLTEPERALHLAPELVRGEAGPQRAADLFALGSALLRCAYAVAPAPGATVLQRMAGGTAFDPAHRVDRLPAWTAGVATIGHGIGRLARLVAADPAERTAADLTGLADDLSGCAEALDPVASVTRARAEHGDQAALRLAQEALLEEESYDLALRAAQLSDDPLARLTYLDEAVRLDPARPEAYAGQFDLIGRGFVLIVRVLSERHPSFVERLDRLVDNAFAHFKPADRDRQTPTMAYYLIERTEYARATRLLHAALAAAGPTRWRKFNHLLAYGRAFLEAGDCAKARRVAQQIRTGLDRAKRDPAVPPADIGRAGQGLRDLEDDIARRCGDRT
jgi:hypothetical protein